ncbi:MAG: AbiH family protein [Faecalicoccus sp.]|uniref:AbiH family protein n=2 Tax=Faecalicoccus TaxID=1573536 RepID=UPI002A82F4F9|nr:AbiH family protein [Faecalicoccus sp.]MDY4278317.1 AbiH family protein [Faecalicoccus sp.]
MKIKKVVIIGNGFDLAHDLPTSYKKFALTYKNHDILKKFERLSKEIGSAEKPSTWYSFEEEIERISNVQFSRTIMDAQSREDYAKRTQEMENCNRLFFQLSDLLMEYLDNVYSNHKISILNNVKQEFLTGGTYTISFNYTDTVKLYTKRYEYIHGNIKDDSSIVLGFSNDQYPDVASGSYIYFNKALLRWRLSYIRYLISRGHGKNIDKYLKEFNPHLNTMYSGKGGWGFPSKINEKCVYYDISKASEVLKEYFLECEMRNNDCNHKFNDVRELVIMGHGLESDKLYFELLSKEMPQLYSATIYTFKGEQAKELVRKAKYLKEQFKVKEIILKEY